MVEKDLIEQTNDLRIRVAVIETLISQGQEVKPVDIAKVKVELENVIKRVDALDSTQTWLVRIIGGALVLAFLGFAFQGGLHPPL